MNMRWPLVWIWCVVVGCGARVDPMSCESGGESACPCAGGTLACDAGLADAGLADAGLADAGGCGPVPVGTIVDSLHFTWAAGTGTASVLERLRPNRTIAAAFHTPTTIGATGSFATVPPVSSVAPSAARYATLSTCAGDFSVQTHRCWVDGTAASTNLQFIVGTPSDIWCVLQPDTDYYFNIGHLDPTSTSPRVFDSFVNTCSASSGCGFYLQFGHT